MALDEDDETFLAIIGGMFLFALAVAGVGWIASSLGATGLAEGIWIFAGIVGGLALLALVGFTFIS